MIRQIGAQLAHGLLLGSFFVVNTRQPDEEPVQVKVVFKTLYTRHRRYTTFFAHGSVSSHVIANNYYY